MGVEDKTRIEFGIFRILLCQVKYFTLLCLVDDKLSIYTIIISVFIKLLLLVA